ncbi:uncharacterized protein LOC123309353 [Coccinella septempunctata]|uniref:uncharacterized protein LOC123309353 n=1 Tax=Coccinella septempunctata TaxID=41139 RepID=UPI001D082AF8|nr:uncharacterized protein LOC123309353 [Coccinella septempunctata]
MSHISPLRNLRMHQLKNTNYQTNITMKVVILLVFALIAIVASVPVGTGDIVFDDQGNAFGLIPLNRVRRQQGDYIKAGAVHSSKYGGGGQIVANKNLASSKHHSVDAQAKYSQYGNHREGWAGINYSVKW